ncbi:unnamed protein product [Spirodela intermedia]|uniref:Uncharacterized protein n=2 Tax=Spirodela intermedia TaxID=51605 RepID=A0A7I8KKL2_SPIIN|nr:unnamed protein product [Spirodela intermedia]CAA6661424.1 unnamed protein product [Spirodela intermedia]CAA7397786.1 unnamed protein product [Spirodela intermedia]
MMLSFSHPSRTKAWLGTTKLMLKLKEEVTDVE